MANLQDSDECKVLRQQVHVKKFKRRKRAEKCPIQQRPQK